MSIFKRAEKLQQDEYDAKIAKGLGRAFAESATDRRQLSRLKLVVFSDLHRGARDGADDFERCEPAYCAALGWYVEQGFELFLLGDVDELWENDIDEVLPGYEGAMALERRFLDGPGLRRFFGNHDLDWKDPKRVRSHFADRLPGLEVIEALRLQIMDGDAQLGAIFFAHGHQGTDLSDRGSWVSRIALRRVWRRVQASQGWLSTTPSESFELRHKHDVAMFRWAKGRLRDDDAGRRAILVAGHTHHPVIPGRPVAAPDTEDAAAVAAKLDEARRDGAEAAQLAALSAELERLRALGRREPFEPTPDDPPCYFNSGCCCFPDRDVTCLVIDAGAISLVRWLDNDGNAKPKQLAAPLDLRELFGRLDVS